MLRKLEIFYFGEGVKYVNNCRILIEINNGHKEAIKTDHKIVGKGTSNQIKYILFNMVLKGILA